MHGVLAPAGLVARAVTASMLSRSTAIRAAALAVAATPLLRIAGAHLRNAWSDYQIRHHPPVNDSRPSATLKGE
jgi:hypothetical protein